jgi:hypothetical protein
MAEERWNREVICRCYRDWQKGEEAPHNGGSTRDEPTVGDEVVDARSPMEVGWICVDDTERYGKIRNTEYGYDGVTTYLYVQCEITIIYPNLCHRVRSRAPND